MKKSIIKSLTAGLLIGSSLTMSACNKGDKVPTITDSSVSSSVAEYLVYDEFKADHLTLTLEMSDNTTKEIAITADMINKMPDMNTPGEKTVTIEYEGVEYTFTFTVGGYYQMFEGMKVLDTKGSVDRIRKDLPVFFVAGADDPVGDFGKGVQRIFEKYKNAAIKDVSIKLYEGDRHEILNEKDREQVYEDLYQWFVNRI